MDRRTFLQSSAVSAAATTGVLAAEPVAKAAASERLRAGVAGLAVGGSTGSSITSPAPRGGSFVSDP